MTQLADNWSSGQLELRFQAGPVFRSPYRSSAARQASRIRSRSNDRQGLRPSCRASIATTWMWSAACRTAIHRTPSSIQRTPSSSSPSDSPVRSITSAAMSPHSTSDNTRSVGAALSRQCHTGLGVPQSPIAAYGCSNSPISLRMSRRPDGRSGGSSSTGGRHPATRCGSTCSWDFPGPYKYQTRLSRLVPFGLTLPITAALPTSGRWRWLGLVRGLRR